MPNAFFRLPVIAPTAKYKLDPKSIIDISKVLKPIESEYYFDFSMGDKSTQSGVPLVETNGNLAITFRNGGLVLSSKGQGGYGFPATPESQFANGYTIINSVKIPKGTKTVTGVAVFMNFFGGDSFSTQNYSSYAWHFSNSSLLCYGKSLKTDGSVLHSGNLLNIRFAADAVAKVFTDDVFVTCAMCVDPSNKKIKVCAMTNQSPYFQAKTLITETSNVLSDTLKLNIGSSFYASGTNADGLLDYISPEMFLLPKTFTESELEILIKERYIRNFG